MFILTRAVTYDWRVKAICETGALMKKEFEENCKSQRSPHNSVGIATGYGMDGLGSIPIRGKRVFSIVCRLALESIQHSIQWVSRAFSPGDEADKLSAAIKNGEATYISTSSHVFKGWCLII
jgi:hypothetical protein